MNKYAKIYIIIVAIFILAIIGSAVYVVISPNNNVAKKNNITNVGNNKEVGKPDEEGKYNITLEDGSKVNISEKKKENKKLAGLTIKNIELIQKNGITKLTADIINETRITRKEQTADITLVSSTDYELAKMGIYIKELKPDEATKLNASITLDYSNAYNFYITK